jgi:hypothetical protein
MKLGEVSQGKNGMLPSPDFMVPNDIKASSTYLPVHFFLSRVNVAFQITYKTLTRGRDRGKCTWIKERATNFFCLIIIYFKSLS